jgi:YD repeat-containing protein
VAIPLRLLRGESTTTYASSKLNRVGRRAARYDSGLSAHKCNRPAHKRPTPHRIAHERIACSRSRCGNSTPFTKLFPLPPVNPCQHPNSLPFAAPAPSPEHNHARYDNDSRLTQVVDPTGTYSFTFDNMGRLTGTTTSYSFLTSRTFTTAYSYDAASNRTGFTDPESGSSTYAYDTLNRLQTLTPPSTISSGNFGFGYDALSRRTSLTRPNSVNTSYSYDNLSRLLSVTHAKSGTTLDGASYTVDNAGNRTAKTDQ